MNGEPVAEETSENAQLEVPVDNGETIEYAQLLAVAPAGSAKPHDALDDGVEKAQLGVLLARPGEVENAHVVEPPPSDEWKILDAQNDEEVAELREYAQLVSLVSAKKLLPDVR